MQRVYTDERFPGCRIVNDGSLVFRVYYNDELLQSFETWETAEQGSKRPTVTSVSEPFARRRAQEYFERWAKMDTEKDTSYVTHEVPLHPEGAETPPPENVTKTIDDLMAKERLETDSNRKRALRRQIMHLMQHEGSVATAVVNELIAG